MSVVVFSFPGAGGGSFREDSNTESAVDFSCLSMTWLNMSVIVVCFKGEVLFLGEDLRGP